MLAVLFCLLLAAVLVLAAVYFTRRPYRLPTFLLKLTQRRIRQPQNNGGGAAVAFENPGYDKEGQVYFCCFFLHILHCFLHILHCILHLHIFANFLDFFCFRFTASLETRRVLQWRAMELMGRLRMATQPDGNILIWRHHKIRRRLKGLVNIPN